MAIKVGFSTSVCPGWDIHKIATQANEMGFYGVELGVVRDELHLPEAEDLQSDKDIDAVRKLFDDNSVELVSLASMYSVESREKHLAKRFFTRNVENIELAAKLGCRYVRIPIGSRVPRETKEATLARLISPFTELARIALKNGVTVLLCNTVGFPSSRSLWFVVDGVSHPGLRCAWDPVLGLASGEHSSLSVPRLGARIAMMLTNDADFDPQGRFVGYRPVGDGIVDFAKTIDLLKGIAFDGYLMLDWPKATVAELPEPQDALPASLELILGRIKHSDPVLTAYGKDKNAPNYGEETPSFVPRKVKGAQDDAAAEGEGEDTGGGEETVKTRVPKGGDPKIAAMVAEAVRKVRAARAAKGG